MAFTSYGQFLSLLLPRVLNNAVNNLALQRCTLCTEVNDDVPSPADGVTDVTLRPIIRLVGLCYRSAARPAGPRSKCTLCTKSRLIDRR